MFVTNEKKMKRIKKKKHFYVDKCILVTSRKERTKKHFYFVLLILIEAVNSWMKKKSDETII
jgi:hypothetical protein